MVLPSRGGCRRVSNCLIDDTGVGAVDDFGPVRANWAMGIDPL